MSEPENPVVTPEKTDASPEPSSDTISKETAAELIGADLLSTMSPAAPARAVQPEVAPQEPKPEPEPEEPEPEPTPSEPEPESPEPEPEAQTPQKTGKRVVKLIETIKAKDVEIETLRSELLAKVNAPPPPVQRPKEQTPEYWAAQYTTNQQQGIPDTDPRQAAIVAKYQEFDEEVKFERFEQRQNQKAASQRASTAFVNSLVEIHEMNPFLVKNEKSAFGVDVDYDSTLGQKMKELSQKEGVALNNAQAVIHYAQRANAIVLHQRLNGENQNATTLKRQLAEGQAKGTITSGTRRAPPAHKGDDAKLKSLTQRANSGKKNDREALAAAALAADLGM